MRVACEGGDLVVEVRDDGIGGAAVGKGSGLSGLADRVGASDGTLTSTARWATAPACAPCCRSTARGNLEAMANSRPVYSTTDGDLRKARDPLLKERLAGGGRVKVRRETSGRRGKAVTTVSGVPLNDDGLRELAGRLKKRCGVGGSVKDGVIELQGDHRNVVMEMLRADGYDVVAAGG